MYRTIFFMLKGSPTLSPHLDLPSHGILFFFFNFLKNAPFSLPAFEVWAGPSDPSIPPHSLPDSWKTNLEIYGLFWSAPGHSAGDPGSFDLARNVRNVKVENPPQKL